MSEKKILIKIDEGDIEPEMSGSGRFYIFYVDGTYTFSDWDNGDDTSQWKIEDDMLCVKHGLRNWDTCTNLPEDSILKEKVAKAMIDLVVEEVILNAPSDS